MIEFGEVATALATVVAAMSAGIGLWVRSLNERNSLRIKDLENSREFLQAQVEQYRDEIKHYQGQLKELRERHLCEIDMIKKGYEEKIAKLQDRVKGLEDQLAQVED